MNFSVTPVWNLPKHAVGSWGFFKPRKPMMVRNLKYGVNTLNYLTKEIANPEIFDSNKMELVLAPKDLYLKDSTKSYNKNINIAA